MLADEVKTGEVDSSLWVPLEDVYAEWEKSGTVGQEVYGAGFPFAVVPRHFIRIADAAYLLFIDYPISEMRIGSEEACFKVLGDERLSCKLYVLKASSGRQLDITVSGKRQGIIEPQSVDGETHCYAIQGDQHLVINWR